MDWAQDMTARWLQIMSEAGDRRTPLDEAVDQINSISGAPRNKPRLGRQKSAGDTAAAAVTALSRLLIVGVLVSDMVLDKLCALSGQTREQVLDQVQMAATTRGHLRDQQVSALQAELSQACAVLQDPERASYSALGGRIEQVLRLAEQQASAIVDEARAEAARITSAASPQPCPKCGAP
jgi:hypothetical protein